MHTPNEIIKKKARRILSGHLLTPIRVMLIAVLGPILLEYPFSLLLNTANRSLLQTILYYLVVFLLGIIGEVLVMGRCLVHICMTRKEYTAPTFAFYGFRNRPDHYFAAAILLQIISTVVSLPLSYMLSGIDISSTDPRISIEMLKILGIALVLRILLRTLLGLFYYVTLDYEECSLKDNIRTTLSLLKKHLLRLLLLNISFIGLIILSCITLGIGFLWTSPYMEQSMAVFYQDCLDEGNRNS